MRWAGTEAFGHENIVSVSEKVNVSFDFSIQDLWLCFPPVVLGLSLPLSRAAVKVQFYIPKNTHKPG
jgi:hypothetical protein